MAITRILVLGIVYLVVKIWVKVILDSIVVKVTVPAERVNIVIKRF